MIALIVLTDQYVRIDPYNQLDEFQASGLELTSTRQHQGTLRHNEQPATCAGCFFYQASETSGWSASGAVSNWHGLISPGESPFCHGCCALCPFAFHKPFKDKEPFREEWLP